MQAKNPRQASSSASVHIDVPTRGAILDTALVLGEQRGWDGVQLHEIARAMSITLADLQQHFDDKNAIAEAWFDRADAALLNAPEASDWRALSPRQRLHRAIRAWLGALTPHRRLTAEMLRYKLQPEHLHLQALDAVRVSRTVQWIREVAWLPSTGWRREAEEATLTAIYLAVLSSWLVDESPASRQTERLLDGLLRQAEWAALAFGGRRGA